MVVVAIVLIRLLVGGGSASHLVQVCPFPTSAHVGIAGM